MTTPLRLPIPRSLHDGPGLIVDLFAGGGGASEGIRMALGRDPDIAINHDPVAVAMHKANHPTTIHHTQDVWAVPPCWATQGRPVDLLWASPDCTHFSKAKGAAPTRDEKRRDLAWVVEKWAREVRPKVIALENVEEFTTWGPLKGGVPVKSQAGTTFRSWVASLRRLGYSVQWRELRACDYRAPTIRKRLFLIARCDGRPIVWPAPTHGDPKSEAVTSGRLKPWRTAAECIDWSIPCPSIFERVRPLAENTMRRIAEGVRRYVLSAAEPFIVRFNTGAVGHGLDEPLRTVTAGGHPKRPSTGTDMGIVVPSIVNLTHGGRIEPGDEPLRTITCAHRGEKAVVAPYLVPRYGEREGQSPRCRSVLDPLATVVTTDNGGQLVSPLLVGAGGPAYGGKPVAADKPFGTLMTENHQAVAAAFLAKHFTGVVGADVRDPAPTVTTIDHNALVAAHLQRDFGVGVGHAADAPCRTTTAGGGGKSRLVTSHLVKLRGTCRHGQDNREPMPTVTAGGTHIGEVRAFLVKYFGTAIGQACDEPTHTATTKHRLGLVTVEIGGEPYVIADIGMRMLQPRELFRAQGFSDDYIIDIKVDGKPISKAAQVRLCGNSVCPDMACAIVAANVPQKAREAV